MPYANSVTGSEDSNDAVEGPQPKKTCADLSDGSEDPIEVPGTSSAA